MRINSILVLVLENNSSCLTYEALGGKIIDTLDVEISGKN
jgi:hypothetical protein